LFSDYEKYSQTPLVEIFVKSFCFRVWKTFGIHSFLLSLLVLPRASRTPTVEILVKVSVFGLATGTQILKIRQGIGRSKSAFGSLIVPTFTRSLTEGPGSLCSSLENIVGRSFIRRTGVVLLLLLFASLVFLLLSQFSKLRIVELILSDMYSLSS